MADVDELLGLVAPISRPNPCGMGMHRALSEAELATQPHPWGRSTPLPFERVVKAMATCPKCGGPMTNGKCSACGYASDDDGDRDNDGGDSDGDGDEVQKSLLRKGIDLIADCAQYVIEKGGEGSRGGKIIGHTQSGKPIYSTHLHGVTTVSQGESHKYETVHHNGKKIGTIRDGGNGKHYSARPDPQKPGYDINDTHSSRESALEGVTRPSRVAASGARDKASAAGTAVPYGYDPHVHGDFDPEKAKSSSAHKHKLQSQEYFGKQKSDAVTRQKQLQSEHGDQYDWRRGAMDLLRSGHSASEISGHVGQDVDRVREHLTHETKMQDAWNSPGPGGGGSPASTYSRYHSQIHKSGVLEGSLVMQGIDLIADCARYVQEKGGE